MHSCQYPYTCHTLPCRGPCASSCCSPCAGGPGRPRALPTPPVAYSQCPARAPHAAQAPQSSHFRPAKENTHECSQILDIKKSCPPLRRRRPVLWFLCPYEAESSEPHTDNESIFAVSILIRVRSSSASFSCTCKGGGGFETQIYDQSVREYHMQGPGEVTLSLICVARSSSSSSLMSTISPRPAASAYEDRTLCAIKGQSQKRH